MRTAVIVDAIRTPSGRGKPGGALNAVHPTDLLAGTIRALVERTGIDPAVIEDVYAGCVTQSGGARRRPPTGDPRHHHRPAVRLQPAGHHLRRAEHHVGG
jgi:acetyl-CoA acetyltransferase